MSIRTPVNLALLGDPEAGQYCEILDLSGLLGDLAVGCASGTAPTITTATLDAIIFGTAFSQTLVATGTEPITWSVSAGALPDGLNLSAAGNLTGTPTASGAYDFTVQATNSIGNDTQQYTGSVAFTPAELFAAGEIGVWFDASDLSTLYQDRAGTTPVTAADQLVGKILDKSGGNNHWTATSDASRPYLRADGSLYYLEGNGTSTQGATAAIDYTATNEHTVCVGIRTNALDGARIILERGNNSSAGPSFASFVNSGVISSRSGGTTMVTLSPAATATTKYVLTQFAKISTPVLTQRQNGVQSGTSASTQGTGNYGNNALNMFARATGALYFAGRIYQVIVRSTLCDATELANVETFVASKTGVTLP